MDSQNNVFGWVVGLIILVAVVLGIWWLASMNSGTPSPTEQAATSTPQGSSAGGAAPVSTEARTSSTVGAVVAGLGGRFGSLYSSTGVGAQITGKGPYTVFVPTDAAFAAANLGSMTAAQQKLLIQNHIVSGKMLDLDAVSSGNYTALSRQSLNFNVQAQTNIAYVGSGYAIKQIKASNGIVYVITAVLQPTLVPNPSTGSTGSPVPTQ